MSVSTRTECLHPEEEEEELMSVSTRTECLHPEEEEEPPSPPVESYRVHYSGATSSHLLVVVYSLIMGDLSNEKVAVFLSV